MALWEVKLQNVYSHQVFYTHLDDLNTLASFMLGLDTNEFTIIKITKLEAGTIRQPDYFMKKEEGLELGIKKEVK